MTAPDAAGGTPPRPAGEPAAEAPADAPAGATGAGAGAAGAGTDTGADPGAAPARRGRAARRQMLLRLDPAVHDALAAWAGAELRSTNAQVEFLLRRALAEAGRLPSAARPIPRRGRPPRLEPPEQAEPPEAPEAP